MKKIFFKALCAVFTISLATFAFAEDSEETTEDSSSLLTSIDPEIRVGLFAQGNAIIGDYFDKERLNVGGGLSGELGLWQLYGKTFGIQAHVAADALFPLGGENDIDADALALIGLFMRFPLGETDFAIQPEVSYGGWFRELIGGVQIEQLVQGGISFRWTPAEICNGRLEFELTPQVGVEIFNTAHNVLAGARLGVLWNFGSNARRNQVRASRATSKIYEMNMQDEVQVSQSEQGMVLTLVNIHFQPDSAELEDTEAEKLDKVAELLMSYKNDLIVSGHCAHVEGSTEEEEIELSAARAATVADYLLNANVRTEEHLSSEGKGATEPIGSNDTPEGRAKNRRVAITLIEK